MDREALARLRSQVSGTVFLPDDEGYDDARSVWNGMIDRRPVAIVRAAGRDDVAPTVRAARDNGIPIALRGGGHNVAGNGTVEGGLVLDLSGLTSVVVDPVARTVRVEPGATLADVDRATEPHGLAVPIGVVSGTGVAGLTLGGGVGWLTRMHGLTADSLVSAEVVTAAGDTVRASEGDDSDLLWGLRGGGGNFGVVTSFTFRAYPHGPQVYAGNLVYGLARMTEAFRAWADWTRELPDELTSITTTMVPPPDWELGAEPLLFVGYAWAGGGADEDRAARVVATLRDAAPPDIEVPPHARWVDWQSAADGLFPKGSRAYWKNTSLDRLDDAVIDVLTERAAEQTWRGTAFDIHHMEGAFGRVNEEATPFPNRAARYWLNVYGYWQDASLDEERVAFVRGLARDVEPHASAGVYVNFMGREPGDDPHAAALAVFGPAKLARLVSLKGRYDPDNLFRLNHNIPPGGRV
jgi:FAD/FMN-containing dehydrogenase